MLQKYLAIFLIAVALFAGLIPSASAQNVVFSCAMVGSALGTVGTCSASCGSGTIDASGVKSYLESTYASMLGTVCASGMKCCLKKSDSLCTVSLKAVGIDGMCASTCSGTKAVSRFASSQELCSTGYCCFSSSQTPGVASQSNSPIAETLQSVKSGTTVSEAVSEDAGSTGSAGYGLINPLGGRTISTLSADLIKWISGIAGVLFVLSLLWSGFEWMISAGDPKKTKQAIDRMVYSILGIVIIFTAYFIVSALIGITNVQF